MENPPNLNYCTIIGNFKAFIADGDDEDDLPDFVPMIGTGQIWPNIATVSNMQPGYKSTYFNSPIPVIVDQDGDLGRNDKKYVKVLVDSEYLGSSGFNYSILLNLSAQNETATRQYGPYTFEVTPGGTVDLSDFVPVSPNSGTPIVRGPQGEIGPEGPVGPLPEITVIETVTGPEVPGTVGPKGDKGDPGGFTAPVSLGTAHLDTIKVPGLYSQTNGNNVTTANGYPKTLSVPVHMQVYVATTDNERLTQEMTFVSSTVAVGSRVKYSRTYYAGTWGPWRLFTSTRIDDTAGKAFYVWDDNSGREQLIYGDTGWRQLDAALLSNSYMGSLQLRRTGYSIILRGAIKPPTGTTTFNGVFLSALPTGFVGATSPWLFYNVRSNGSPTFFTLYKKGAELSFESSPTVTDVSEARFEITFATTDPWPTTLPGVAVGTIPNL